MSKCPGCEFFKDNVCFKAENGLISQLEGDCLTRCVVILLRNILEALEDDEGEDWKNTPQ